MCERLQISHTFFDAPGAAAATFVEGREAHLAPGAKPYVTMVFCGPADYKVNLKRKLMPKSGSTDAFLHLIPLQHHCFSDLLFAACIPDGFCIVSASAMQQ